MGFIYKITNTVSGKVYIGETKMLDPNHRWRQHIASLKRNGGCPALKDAMKTYGVDKFKFDIVIICFDSDRLLLERQYIRKYNSIVPNGYNILDGGQKGGGFKGKKHSTDTRSKITETLKNYYKNHPEERLARSIRVKEYMKGIDARQMTLSSEKFKQAVAEGRVGGHNIHKSICVKKKNQ